MKKKQTGSTSRRLEDFNSVARSICIKKFGGDTTKYLRSIGYAVQPISIRRRTLILSKGTYFYNPLDKSQVLCYNKIKRRLKVPPTFKFTPDRGIELDQNDRGEWKCKQKLSCGREFIGFGGENTLIIIESPMQSGQNHIMVIHACVDSPIEYISSTGPTETTEEAINLLVKVVCHYPEKLPKR